MVPINQLIASVVANIGAFNFGMSIGWLSPAIPQFNAEDLPIGNVTTEDTAWLASAFPISGVIAMPILTLLSQTYGRKLCIIFTAIPFVVNGIAVVVAKNLNTLLVGRVIMGIGVAGLMANLPSYSSEIAEPRVRGTLSSILTLAYTSGITAAYITGGYISYVIVGWISIVLGILNIVLMLFMPDSPVYLLKCGKKIEAAEALGWLRRLDPLNLEIKLELDRLMETISKNNKTSMKNAAKLLLFSKPLRKGFLICFVMISIQGFCGMIAVHSYSIAIFMEGGAAALGRTGASVVYGSIQIFGSISSVSLVDRIGRKVLMVGSCFGMCLAMMVLAIYFQLKQTIDLSNIDWLPVVSLSFCVYIYTIGCASIPYVILADLLTNEVRNLATMLIVQVLFLETFLVLRLYSPLLLAYGMHTLFYIFGTFSLVGAILSLIILTETKGKTPQEIQDSLK